MEECRKSHNVAVKTSDRTLPTDPKIEAWSYCEKTYHDVHVAVSGVPHINFRIPKSRHKGAKR